MGHNILNKKAQINLGFIVSILLLIILTISATLIILQMLPGIQDDARINTIQARALDLSKIIIEDPGFPTDWSGGIVDPLRFGLAEYNNYSNLTILGQLDKTNVETATSTYSYNFLKNSLGIENTSTLNFRLIIENKTSTILDLYEYPPPNTTNIVTLNRFTTLNGTLVNVTLVVWQ